MEQMYYEFERSTRLERGPHWCKLVLSRDSRRQDGSRRIGRRRQGTKNALGHSTSGAGYRTHVIEEEKQKKGGNKSGENELSFFRIPSPLDRGVGVEIDVPLF